MSHYSALLLPWLLEDKHFPEQFSNSLFMVGLSVKESENDS